MEAKIPIVIFAYWMSFTLFAARTVIETEQMTITSVWVIQILVQRCKRLKWSNPLNRENLSNIFHFLFHSFIPFLQRPTMRPTVQRHTMLVEYAEHRAAASEAAGSPYFINWMTCNIQVDDSFFSVELLHLC